MFPPGRSKWIIRATLPGGLIAAALLLSGCAATTDATPDQAVFLAEGHRDADKLLVVDCLLPGQIRQLGRQMTYLTPRRPIKTSAADCEIRGGEYVAYDRANYATALNVWLPQAEAGDPVAQTYVGEIYEKGLGLAPDYALAARWYQKAAEQGYSRAQVNLGALYEQGLGVQKDPVMALNLYRQASGLIDDQLAFTSSIEELEAERHALRQEIALRQQETVTLRSQLQRTQQQLESQRQRLQATEQELQQTRRELQQQQSAPSTPAREAATQELERRLAEQQARLEQQRQEMAYLQQETEQRQAQLTAELRAAQRKEEELRHDVEYQARERESLQQQVDYLHQQLVATHDQLIARKQELEEQQRRLRQAQEQLEREQRSATASDAELSRLEQQLRARDAELIQTRQQVAELESEVQRRQAELEQIQAEQVALARQVETTVTNDVQPTRSIPPYSDLNFGRYHALLIGNNRYPQFPDLETTVNDVQALARVLKNRYGFETRVLTNADRYAILSALNEFRAKLTERDNFLLYYAGHGELDRPNLRGHWLPVDAEPDSTANWIPDTQITEILNAMSAKHAMVIADSCYAGTMTRAITTSIEGGRSPEKHKAWLELMINTRSRTVITSGGLKPVFDGGGDGHSLFARRLLAVLETNDDILEGPILYQQVASLVRRAAAQLNVEQDPEYAPIKFAGDLGAPFFFTPVELVSYHDILEPFRLVVNHAQPFLGSALSGVALK